MNKLYDSWRFALATYDYPTGKESLFSSAIDFIPLDFDLDYGYIVRYQDRLIFAFRGTKDFRTKNGWKAWKGNIDTYPLEQDGTIHNGFYDAWKPFKVEIDSYLKIMERKKSLVLPSPESVGQSRGGCTCTLCARHLAKNRNILCTGISYGSPRVGTKAFRNEFNTLPIDFTRVVNGYDFAKTVPFHFLGFRHVGKLYWLQQPFWHRYFCKIYDHIPKNYTKALLKLN